MLKSLHEERKRRQEAALLGDDSQGARQRVKTGNCVGTSVHESSSPTVSPVCSATTSSPQGPTSLAATTQHSPPSATAAGATAAAVSPTAAPLARCRGPRAVGGLALDLADSPGYAKRRHVAARALWRRRRTATHGVAPWRHFPTRLLTFHAIRCCCRCVIRPHCVR